MLKHTIKGLEKALEELRELERLTDLDSVMALFDELNSAPLPDTNIADQGTRRRPRRKRETS